MILNSILDKMSLKLNIPSHYFSIRLSVLQTFSVKKEQDYFL